MGRPPQKNAGSIRPSSASMHQVRDTKGSVASGMDRVLNRGGLEFDWQKGQWPSG